ncbi:hypothetical protein ACNAW0_28945 [Micromonospora sp. SL1-18]|uniref:hypothetical protein n=1 Tax=Micromonospora sp. SL1-18 TaxID=3399128 RepID=UPI003A4D4D9A
MSITLASSSGTTIGATGTRALRTAALGAFGFDVFYVVHRLLQGLGPDGDTPAAVAAFNVAHRSALVASEVAVGAALLAAIVFVAALAPVIRRAGQDTLATAVAISGAVFVTLGFVSQAAETALVGAADAGDLSAVLALNQLQGRMPVVWSITALTAAVSLSALRTGLLAKWLGVGGLVAAGVFALGSTFSVLGRGVEGNSSLFGVGLFIVWMLLLAVFLWGAAGRVAGPEFEQEQRSPEPTSTNPVRGPGLARRWPNDQVRPPNEAFVQRQGD